MSGAPQSFVGNASWGARTGRSAATGQTGQTGPTGHNGRSRDGRKAGTAWATFGFATDDGRYFDVSAFGSTASTCAQVRKGDRLRLTSREEPRREVWVGADGREHEAWRIVATKVEKLPPLPAEDARANVVARLLAARPEAVLGQPGGGG